MKRWRVALAATFVALTALGCGSIFDDDDVAVSAQCWTEIYEDADFVRDRAWTRIQGPSELGSIRELAGRDWNDSISSMRIGPDAIVQIFEHADFRGEVREYDYGRFVDDLSDDDMNDKVSSIKIRCR